MSVDRPVTLAAVTGAHGVTGEVRLKLFGEGVAALRRFRAFNDSSLTLKSLKDRKLTDFEEDLDDLRRCP